MYCSDGRKTVYNVLSFSFKMVYTVLEQISNSLHISAYFDFSCLSTAFIITTLLLIVLLFLLIDDGCDAMAI